MTIRRRLTAMLALVVLPLLVGSALVLAVMLPARLDVSQKRGLESAARTVGSSLRYECLLLGDRAQLMALALANGRSWSQVTADQLAGATDPDGLYAVATIPGVGTQGTRYAPKPLSTSPPAKPCSSTPDPAEKVAAPPKLVERVTLSTSSGDLTVLVVLPITPARVQALVNQAQLKDSRIALRCPGGEVLESTDVGLGDVEQVAPAQAGQPCAVSASATAPAGDASRWWTIAALLGTVFLGGVMVAWLARALTAPIVEISQAARRATAGDLAVRLPEERTDEIGDLARDFNTMSSELEQKIFAVESSRDALRDSVRRVGDALARTHDLDGLLGSLCALAESATGGEVATVWMREGSSLLARVVHPVGTRRPSARRLPPAGNLPGEALRESRWQVSGDASQDPASILGGRMLAAPLLSGDRVLGVIAVERPASLPPFDTDESERLAMIAGPSGVAIDNAMLHRAAQRQSVIDPLTGVGNMRLLTSTLGREVERAQRFDRFVSLLVVDIDGFRGLNDRLGPTLGDGVLTAVAARLAKAVRSVDTVARYGGEEFAVICPELSAHDGMLTAERLVRAFREQPLTVGEHEVEVRVSVGVATWPVHAHSAPELMEAAYAAMVTAKNEGRDRAAEAVTRPGPDGPARPENARQV